MLSLSGLLVFGAFAAVVPTASVSAHSSPQETTYAALSQKAISVPANLPNQTIPRGSICVRVTVHRGDTLGVLATRYGTTWQEMARINQIKNPNLIFPNQVFSTCGTSFVPSQHPTQPKYIPAAPPKNSVSSAPAAISGGSVQNIIRQVFGSYANQALRVAQCESGFNPFATNPSSSASGVFQFLRSTWAGTPYANRSVFDADANVRAAYWLFVQDGYSWREWVCRP